MGVRERPSGHAPVEFTVAGALRDVTELIVDIEHLHPDRSSHERNA
jgi:hypothetical protein